MKIRRWFLLAYFFLFLSCSMYRRCTSFLRRSFLYFCNVHTRLHILTWHLRTRIYNCLRICCVFFGKKRSADPMTFQNAGTRCGGALFRLLHFFPFFFFPPRAKEKRQKTTLFSPPISNLFKFILTLF